MKLVFLVLCLSLQLVHGQDIISVSQKKGTTREDYSVLASDKEIMHGVYKKINENGDVVAEGQYQYGQRSGEWKFYIDGEIEQRYNYSTNELIQFKKPTYSLQYTGGEQLDSPPLFIGGKEGLNEKLNELIKYPDQAIKAGVDGKVSASFTLNVDNTISDVQIFRGIGAGCDEGLWSALKKINTGWLTGKVNGQPVKCDVRVTVQYLLNEDGTTTIRLI